MNCPHDWVTITRLKHKKITSWFCRRCGFNNLGPRTWRVIEPNPHRVEVGSP